MRSRHWILVVAALVTWYSPSATADVKIVAADGDAVPDGSGIVLAGVEPPIINESGQVAFSATLRLNGFLQNTGVFIGTEDRSALRLVVRASAPAPNSNGRFSNVSNPSLNDAGQVAFNAAFAQTFGGSADDVAIVRADAGGSLATVAREGQAATGGEMFGSGTQFSTPVINAAGQVAFVAGGSSVGDGLYLQSQTGLTQIATFAQPTPDGLALFSVLGDPLLNDQGTVVFGAVVGEISGPAVRTGIWMWDESGLKELAFTGQTAADGNGTISGLGTFALNNDGDIVFFANLGNTSGGASDNQGIFRFRASENATTTIARRGSQAPDGNGLFFNLAVSSALSMNDEGDVAFAASLTGTIGGTVDSLGVFHSDGSSIEQISRTGDLAPDGNGRFTSFGIPGINSKGQIAFIAPLFGTANPGVDDNGLFLYDPTAGLLQAARTGEAIQGETGVIGSPILFLHGAAGLGQSRTGLNDSGQLAFRFTLNGNYVVALADPFVVVPTATPSASSTPTQTPTMPFIPSATPTRTPSPTRTPRAPTGACAADCGGDGAVTVDELIVMVNIALGVVPIDRCVTGDVDGDGTISISEIIAAVNGALIDCTVLSSTELMSVNRAGTAGGNGNSFDPSVSGDGRFLAFASVADDLVPASLDTNRSSDVFLYDAQTGGTTLVSYNRTGTASGNDGSVGPVLSRDGRFVVFQSAATDMVDGISDLNGRRDLFVRNLETGVTTLVSVNFAGTGTGTGDFGSAVVSSDGCFVAFTSSASDLVGPGIDTNNLTDVFVRDLQAGVTMLVSVNERGTASGNEHSLAPTISADGHRIAFLSGASNLVADGMDDNAAEDVFVRDIESGVTTLVSVNSAGTGSAETHSTMPVISADGRVVAFKSFADDLAAPGIDSNLTGDVFVRDLAAGTTAAPPAAAPAAVGGSTWVGSAPASTAAWMSSTLATATAASASGPSWL